MHRSRMLILLVLVLLAPALTTVAAERPAPVPRSGQAVAGLSSRPERQGAAQRQADEDANTQDDRRRQQRGDKSKKPTCFGLKATINDHKGEITGTSGDDVIIGDAGSNRIFVNTGGQTGVDRVCAGGGDDFITKECCDGVLIATGGPGNDELFGGVGGDVLFGGDGNDLLRNGAPDDDGGDLLLGERGTDTLQGDGQNDTCQQSLNSEPIPC